MFEFQKKILAGEGKEGTEVQHNNNLSQLRPTEERYVFPQTYANEVDETAFLWPIA